MSPALLAASAVLLPHALLHAVDANWNVNAGGSWNTGSNWTGSAVPGGVDSVAGLTFDITGNHTVTINTTSATLGTLNIGDPAGTNTYTLAASGGASLIFEVSSGAATLNKSSGGSDNISAPVVLNSDLDIINTVGTGLRLTGIISGNNAISISGNMGNSGSVMLENNSNSFAGNISVNGTNARLAVTSDLRLGNLTNNLTLSNGGSVFVDSMTVFNAERQITLGGTGGRIAMGSNNAGRYSTFAGNISGVGGLTIGQTAGALTGNNSLVNLSGHNTFTGGVTIEQSLLKFASKDNLGATKTIAFGTGGGAGLSILGTEVSDLSDFTISFNSGGPVILDIQDPDNVFLWDKNYNASYASSGSSVLSKSGRGTLEVTVAQSYNNTNSTGFATGLNGGKLLVNHGAGGSLLSGGRATFNGGTLHLQGSTTSASAQTLGNLRVGTGGGSLVVESRNAGGMTATLGSFSSIAPLAGGALNIETIDTAGSAVATTTELNTNGIIGLGRVVFNGTHFATNTTNLSGGAIGGYTVATAGYGDTTAGSTVNYQQGGSATLGATTAHANTLRIATTGPGGNLDLNGQALRLTTGALLFTGADDYQITNGTLASATASNSDLIIHQHAAGTLTINSVIANGNGASTLTKAGSGTLVLGSANTYTGQTYVNGGTVSVSADNRLGSGTLNLNGGKLRVTSGFTTNRAVILGGNGGAIDVADDETLVMTGLFAGLVGGLTLDNSGDGTGVLQLGGGNTFAGGVTINSGVLRLANDAAIGAAGANPLHFGAGTTATLQINGARNISVAALTSSNEDAVVENGAAGAARLVVNNGADNTYEGVIRDGAAGTLGLTKGGGGMLELTGASTYTGPTLVAAGTLLVNGSLGNSAVTVAEGATLAGSGTLGGSTTVQSGGILSPGNSPGLLTGGGDMGFLTGSYFVFELAADTTSGLGLNFDAVNVGGTLTIQSGVTSNLVFNGMGSMVDFSSGFWDSDQSWLVFSSGAIIAGGSVFGTLTTTVDSLGADFSSTGGVLGWRVDGTDVYLDYAAIPEPVPAFLLSIGFTVVCLRRSRRDA